MEPRYAVIPIITFIIVLVFAIGTTILLYTAMNNQSSQYEHISTQLNNLINEFDERIPLPNNCQEILAKTKRSGIYHIFMPKISPKAFEVACDGDTAGGGWTVVLRRQDGSVNFDRNWDEYKQGFGNVRGDFFIGLDKLHAMTTGEPKQEELYFKIENFENITKHTVCSYFVIGDEVSGYKINIDECEGPAGDSITYHNGMRFSTKDVDNDFSDSESCAVLYKGGWWYRSCMESLLTGRYITDGSTEGILWKSFPNKEHGKSNMKFAEMLIRTKINK